MVRSRFGPRTRIPKISTAKTQTKEVSFKKGLATYKANDDVKPDELVYATDARFRKIGRYRTRRGCDRFSVPVGEAVAYEQGSTSGADVVALTPTTAVAQSFTVPSAGRATSATVRIQRDDGFGVVLAAVHADDGGEPGERLGRSSIAASSISETFDDVAVEFMTAPAFNDTDTYWLVVYRQAGGTGNYELSTTTDGTNALVSNNSGVSWTPAGYDINVSVSTSDSGGVKGVFRAYRPNGQRVTLMAHGEDMYEIDEVSGVATSIKSGLEAAATHYRFQMVQDTIYWVNGLEKPYKYDFTDVEQVTASPYDAYLELEHKGLLFFVDTDDPTRLFYSNFAEYDVFTSTDFIYVPAPKSYDDLTALAKLNGVLFLFANRNKFMLLGSDNATFSLDEAPGQKGTFSQESVAFDHNYIWFASDDGIYQFNGTTEKNIAEDVLDWYEQIGSRDNIVLDLYDNRLYVFYSPPGQAENQRCRVYNTLLGVWESEDTKTFIGRTFGRGVQEQGIFIQASNLVGALYYGERESNDHHNLGDILEYELRTAYSTFDAPSQNKRIPKWRPTFESAGLNYGVDCGYAFDMGDSATYQTISLTSDVPKFNMGYKFNTGVKFGGRSLVDPTQLFIPGSHKRIQRRYRHHAAREPIEFVSEVLSVEVQRLP